MLELGSTVSEAENEEAFKRMEAHTMKLRIAELKECLKGWKSADAELEALKSISKFFTR